MPAPQSHRLKELAAFERLRLAPQIAAQPTHPVRQYITGHGEVCGNIAVVPALYNPALQERAVIWKQIAEKLAKPIRCGVHRGDLGKASKAEDQLGWAPEALPLPSKRVQPPKYGELERRPTERPRNSKKSHFL